SEADRQYRRTLRVHPAMDRLAAKANRRADSVEYAAAAGCRQIAASRAGARRHGRLLSECEHSLLARHPGYARRPARQSADQGRVHEFRAEVGSLVESHAE